MDHTENISLVMVKVRPPRGCAIVPKLRQYIGSTRGIIMIENMHELDSCLIHSVCYFVAKRIGHIRTKTGLTNVSNLNPYRQYMDETQITLPGCTEDAINLVNTIQGDTHLLIYEKVHGDYVLTHKTERGRVITAETLVIALVLIEFLSEDQVMTYHWAPINLNNFHARVYSEEDEDKKTRYSNVIVCPNCTLVMAKPKKNKRDGDFPQRHLESCTGRFTTIRSVPTPGTVLKASGIGSHAKHPYYVAFGDVECVAAPVGDLCLICVSKYKTAVTVAAKKDIAHSCTNVHKHIPVKKAGCLSCSMTIKTAVRRVIIDCWKKTGVEHDFAASGCFNCRHNVEKTILAEDQIPCEHSNTSIVSRLDPVIVTAVLVDMRYKEIQEEFVSVGETCIEQFLEKVEEWTDLLATTVDEAAENPVKMHPWKINPYTGEKEIVDLESVIKTTTVCGLCGNDFKTGDIKVHDHDHRYRTDCLTHFHFTVVFFFLQKRRLELCGSSRLQQGLQRKNQVGS